MAEIPKNLWASVLSSWSVDDRTLIAFESRDEIDVLADILEAAENAKSRSIEKRWRFRQPGQGQILVLRDLFSKIVVWINRFRGIGNIVVQYDPGHAALPWAGLRFLLTVLFQIKCPPFGNGISIAVSDIDIDFVVEGGEKLSLCISRFAIFEHLYLRREGCLRITINSSCGRI